MGAGERAMVYSRFLDSRNRERPPRPAAPHRRAGQSARPGHRESGGKWLGVSELVLKRHRRGQAGGSDDAASLRREQHMLRGTHGESTRRALGDDPRAFVADETRLGPLITPSRFRFFQLQTRNTRWGRDGVPRVVNLKSNPRDAKIDASFPSPIDVPRPAAALTDRSDVSSAGPVARRGGGDVHIHLRRGPRRGAPVPQAHPPRVQRGHLPCVSLCSTSSNLTATLNIFILHFEQIKQCVKQNAPEYSFDACQASLLTFYTLVYTLLWFPLYPLAAPPVQSPNPRCAASVNAAAAAVARSVGSRRAVRHPGSARVEDGGVQPGRATSTRRTRSCWAW